MAAFDTGRDKWLEQLGGLRDVIRQELIARQLSPLARPGLRVLDVGAGQGTQAVRLAALGCDVTCLEPDPALRELCAAAATTQHVAVRQVDGVLQNGVEVLAGERFDLVCAHGVLMYLDDRSVGLSLLAGLVKEGGRLSVAFRNGDALAARPGMRRDWQGAIAAMSTDSTDRYVNGIGVEARSDRLHDVEHDLAGVGMRTEQWFGVRVFNDAVAHGTPVPAGEDMAALLDAEELAGMHDPYRWFGSLIHLISVK